MCQITYAPFNFLAVTGKALRPNTDVMFILDASKHVKKDDFDNARTFIKNLVRDFQISAFGASPSGPRACVIIYSSNVYEIIPFARNFTRENFYTKLDATVPLGNSWNVAEALRLSHTIFLKESSARYKIAVLVTTGHYGYDGYVNKETLDSSLQHLRALHAKLYIITTGGVYERRELNPLVTDPEDIFVVPSTKGLHSILNPVQEHIRKTYGKETQ